MAPSSPSTVTRLLKELEGGNRVLLDELFPLVYEELHALAHEQRWHWPGDYTLNTTVLHPRSLPEARRPDTVPGGRLRD